MEKYVKNIILTTIISLTFKHFRVLGGDNSDLHLMRKIEIFCEAVQTHHQVKASVLQTFLYDTVYANILTEITEATPLC